ncbi:TPA: putative bifunctional diguanylate cyclase/phosphodiesterase [Vibrio parahaemolyticus]|uniref:putative bifunctional diguanylate cyclase/phosphodiesterase n=1 Tax=Vibrio parahaemolyticus TaxID=670 RepID=UPI00226A3B29|nr:bifunctional diguanylate cyclase/phosphodiesterase [Vibrio parahaemolyticus]MCX8855338.1 bifunctional diguanylate cyclase/phosphodiesterase [Vibrio parahaemolyticus]MCX8862434.1 bifunctional diguanylate cyclase/phosphodiesterase [Vibrio parahaemolyticus]MCX8865608.1 bifunctional diguanylate cyclase/phosphodiesterase [Vibrio parahaemolyticus]MCX8895837.1 bifunctional diguanylate cyclase/phosphodiesterase [Vibrio parahaemolyticus]MCX8916662.1 bifunctional diguanylate cyclase/phosphodiesterase
MKKAVKKISSKKIITISAIIVSIYLAILIVVTSLGQNKLKDSQYRELDLKVKSYASTLDNLFTIASEDVDNLSSDKTVQTFFANLASGMSMEYGLGASLINLKRRFDEKIDGKLINSSNIYNKLTLVGSDGTTIVTTGPKDLKPMDIHDLMTQHGHPEEVCATRDGDNIRIQVIKQVKFSGKPVAFLIADINKDIVIEQLTNQEHEDSYSRMVLKIKDVEMVVWDSITKNSTTNADENHFLSKVLDGKIYFEVPVEQHHFKLMAWFEPLNERDIFTSRLFIVGLSILAVMIVIALCYAFIANNNKLELKIKLEEEKKRKDILSQQNHKLTKEIERRKASENELAFQAKYDTLTELPNRSYGSERLALELIRASRTGSKVLVMFIDLDHFKQINDSMGHFVGDEILKLSAQRLQNVARKTDLLARIGGDEFLLVIPDLPDNDTAKRVASSVLSAFSEPFVWNNHEFFLTGSVGMSVFPDDGDNAEQLLACADMAMYRVKQDGRDAFCFYNHNMNQDLQRYLDLESRLRNAISNQLLEMYYQPIIELKSGKIVGAEALMRWNDEKFGFVNPEEFISIAEKNGLIHQLGEFAIQQACHQASQWQSISPLFVSVNFSSVQFRYCDRLLAFIRQSLEESGLPAEQFDVEVTESLLFNHDGELVDMLDNLRALGTKLTIDDFGTGYSALSYLQKFPFDRLKIDRSFMQNVFENDSDRELVNVIIAMAKALRLKIVAEGIEEQRHVDYLNELNCEFGQGFHYSRPVPAKEFEQLLNQATWS